MSKFETTLRQIIYHYSQDTLPVPIAIENRKEYQLRSGKKITFAPILPEQDMSIDERIEICRDILVPSSLGFFSDEMRNQYYDIFCIENLEREIEYETTAYFLMRWKANIRKCILKYNKMYEIITGDIDFLSDYERRSSITDNDDITHGKQINGTGTDTLTHGLKVESKSKTKGEGKTVFEDTPENELLNENYATSITKTGNESSGENTTTNSGADINQMVNQTKESGKTERDYTRTLHDIGRNRGIPEILQEFMDKQTNIIENMVIETSKGLFMKIY